MIVKDQLKHLLVLLQDSNTASERRLTNLLFYTPIKAEVASKQTKELLDLCLKMKIITKDKDVYLPNMVIETSYIDKLTDSEIGSIKSAIKNSSILLSEIGNSISEKGTFNFDNNNLLHMLLLELDLLKRINKIYYLDEELLSLLKTEKLVWKYEDKESVELGKFAEKTIYNQEYERLSKSAKLLEKLKHVSLENDALGYDIKSYDLDEQKDVYIEVKGTTFDNVHFFLTAKELDTAMKLKKQYRIKVVCGINLQKRAYKSIIEIENPSKSIFTKYKTEPYVFKVSELD